LIETFGEDGAVSRALLLRRDARVAHVVVRLELPHLATETLLYYIHHIIY
jgi:hypothetical protein